MPSRSSADLFSFYLQSSCYFNTALKLLQSAYNIYTWFVAGVADTYNDTTVLLMIYLHPA